MSSGGGGGGGASVCFFLCVGTSYVMCSLFRYDAKSVMDRKKSFLSQPFTIEYVSLLHMLSARATMYVWSPSPQISRGQLCTVKLP